MARMTKADFAAQTAAGQAEDAARKAQLAAARKEARELKAKREAEEADKAAKVAAAEQAAIVAAAAAAAHAQTVQPEAAAATAEELGSAFDFSALPSWKRVLCGFVLGIVSACAVGYGIGMLAAYAIAGIMMLTTSSTIALILSICVWIIALAASWKIGGWIGGKVFSSVVMPEGLASRSVESVSNAVGNAKSKVRGFFTAKPEVVQFTGAHAKSAA